MSILHALFYALYTPLKNHLTHPSIFLSRRGSPVKSAAARHRQINTATKIVVAVGVIMMTILTIM